MAVVFDLALFGVFGFFVFRGFWKGFMKSVLAVGRMILSVLLTILFGSVFCRWLSETFAWPFSAVLGYILLFAVLFTGLTVLIFLVGKITALPVIKQCDKLLGTLLGVVQGWIAVSLLAAVMYAVVYLSGHLDVYEASAIFKPVHRLNIFEFLINYMI